MKKLLIYDPLGSGHHKEYIFHLLDYLKSESACAYRKVHFCIHPDFKLEVEALGVIPNTIFYWMEDLDFSPEKIISYIKQNELTHFCFMFIDTELTDPYFINKLHQNDTKILGIYFRPFHRISDIYGSFKKMIKYQGIRLQYGWHLSRSILKIDKLFVLNDLEAIDKVKNLSEQVKVSFLPDPISTEEGKTLSAEELRKKLGIPPESSIVLSYGTQFRRKNALPVIDALDLVLEKFNQSIYYLIVGKIYEADYLEEITKSTEEFNAKHDNSKVIVINGYVERDVYFELADIVAIPYIDFFYSSGVFLHAIHNGKPVLTSKFGLMNELTEQYQLGQTVNPHQKETLAKGLLALLKNGVPAENFERYLKENDHSPWVFAKTILA